MGLRVEISMARVGVYENAMIGRFFKTPKYEKEVSKR